MMKNRNQEIIDQLEDLEVLLWDDTITKDQVTELKRLTEITEDFTEAEWMAMG